MLNFVGKNIFNPIYSSFHLTSSLAQARKTPIRERTTFGIPFFKSSENEKKSNRKTEIEK